MPSRCYVVRVPAQTTAPNLRPSWRVVVDRTGSEPQPPQCKCGALPTELSALRLVPRISPCTTALTRPT